MSVKLPYSLKNSKHLGWLVAILCASWLGACEEEATSLYLPTSFPPDSGTPDAALDVDVPPPFEPPAPAAGCELGTVRCLASATPAIERCAVTDPELPEATRWTLDSCPDDQVCIDGRCGGFTCVPGRDTCRGLLESGICDDAGLDLLEPRQCEEGSVCRGGQCVDPCEVAVRDRSYIGCDYVVLDLPNPLREDITPDPPFGLVVANGDPVLAARLTLLDPNGVPTSVLGSVTVVPDLEGTVPVTVGSSLTTREGTVVPLDGPVLDLELPPGAVATLLLPKWTVPFGASGVFRAARRLTSTLPVVAYQFNPYCCNTTFTNDASLLLPTTAAGQDYTLLGAADMRFEFVTDALGLGFTMVALSDQTLSVRLPPGVRLRAPLDDTLTLPEPDDDFSTEVEVALQAGEVLYLESLTTTAHKSVLSGARARSSAPFVAFSTHPCTYIPQSLPACDHLEQQLIPADTWGQTYVMAPTARRGSASTEINYWHFTAGAEPARLRLTSELRDLRLRTPFALALTDCRDYRGEALNEIELPAGAHCMLGTAEAFGVEASSPVMVMGYIVGQDAATANVNQLATGDPAMFLLPPVEQFRDRYLFLTPGTYAFDFATAIIPFNGAETLTLDGRPVDLRDREIRVLEVPGSQHLVVHIPVTDGAHTIEAATSFGLIVYAYDNYVSYAYPGGLNLSKRK